MAQEQFRYEMIFEEHNSVLRADPKKFEAAIAQVQQSPLVAKPGQRWEPAADGVDEYLACCNDICCSVPQDVNDRVKIMYAAHAALVCLVNCRFGRQSEKVQLTILKRHNELMLSAYPTPPIPDNCEAPLSKPSAHPRHITAEDLRLFQNPDHLHGKQFILSPVTENSGMYEVISYFRKRDKTVQYEVLFDDCGDPIKLDAEEMMVMLKDSLCIPV